MRRVGFALLVFLLIFGLTTSASATPPPFYRQCNLLPRETLLWSPDAMTLAVSLSGEVALVDTSRPDSPPRRLGGVPGHSARAFDPAGHTLLTIAGLYDVQSGERLLELSAQGFTYFSPSGAYLRSSEIMWDTATLAPILTGDHYELSPRESLVYALSPDERDGGLSFRLWHLADLSAEPVTLRTAIPNYTYPIFSQDETLLALAHEANGAIQIWDTVSGAQLAVLPQALPSLNAIRFSPDGRYIATSSTSPSGTSIWEYDRSVRVWETQGWTLVAEWSGVNDWYFTADGSMLIFTQDSDEHWPYDTLAWDTATRETQRIAERHPHPENARVSGIDKGRKTYTFTWMDDTTANSVQVLELGAASDLPAGLLLEGRLSPDGRRYLEIEKIEEDDRLGHRVMMNVSRLIDTVTGAILLSARSPGLEKLHLSPDGRLAVYRDENCETHMIETETAQEIAALPQADQVVFNADWSRAAYVMGQSVYVRDLTTGVDWRLSL